jgi:hypothetical protein
MKKILLILIFGILFQFGKSQYFEGIVTYEVKNKNPLLDSMADSTSIDRYKQTKIYTYYFKDDKYKVIENKERVFLYEPRKNRIYDYRLGSNSVIQIEANPYLKKTINIKHCDSIEVINGIECQCLSFDSRIGKIQYFYSKEFCLNAEKFEEHKFRIWEDYLSETGLIPLKCVIKNAFLNETLTVIDIQRKELSEEIFKLPKFKHKEKYSEIK